MKFSTLLAGMDIEVPEIEACDLTLDSRWVKPGDAFVALAGGIAYLDDAVRRGAVAALVDAAPPEPAPLPVIVVPDLRARLGELAGRFYGHPDRELTLIAVTGTDGKTSTTHYIAQALNATGCRCAVIGTLGVGWPDHLVAEGNGLTTPDVITLQRTLARLRAQGAQAVALEASSHGLSQGRLDGVAIDVAGLTHLSRDHLDYHGSLEAYVAAKRRLFERSELRVAVLNEDCAFGRDCRSALVPGVRVVAYTLADAPHADVTGRIASSDRHGLVLDMTCAGFSGRLETRLRGAFNGPNLLAALGALLGLGVDVDRAIRTLGQVTPVPGRMELFCAPGRPLVALDYAHTPNALETVLRDFRTYVAGRIWCVMGAMGRRDRGKRPLMSEVAARWADHIVLTDSLTHGEDPDAIIADLRSGLPSGAAVDVVHDRAAAIAYAVDHAGPEDGVFIAGTGKGNERESIDLNGQVVASDYAHLSACLEVVS
ncbi:Mur ligase family protein [Acidihalobacter ferrooxydans]|uniref:UDP-N-acetylmuramyl-tripeptide synthetase n=1 Tax=Acidihalobacter ferrooxydans TaxID=1765967 RepID=A0A1P8UDB7_9GAMM|nr:UDP-N-acetylmuramoyl-L-alanyl-D-glutamate--2,6-diaminopimelate ligase [Acidihalobacter ferrooxydans]APZ41818.1 hypothetical protein BW247_00835 [Acidihalobacter ferrooxydans]